MAALAHMGCLAMSRDIFSCHTASATAIEWVDARHAGNQPTVHRTAPTTKRCVQPKMATAPKLKNLDINTENWY